MGVAAGKSMMGNSVYRWAMYNFTSQKKAGQAGEWGKRAPKRSLQPALAVVNPLPREAAFTRDPETIHKIVLYRLGQLET